MCPHIFPSTIKPKSLNFLVQLIFYLYFVFYKHLSSLIHCFKHINFSEPRVIYKGYTVPRITRIALTNKITTLFKTSLSDPNGSFIPAQLIRNSEIKFPCILGTCRTLLKDKVFMEVGLKLNFLCQEFPHC